MGYVFDYKLKICWSVEGVVMIVLNCMDMFVDELIVDIINILFGYGGVDGDEWWVVEICCLVYLCGVIVLVYNY